MQPSSDTLSSFNTTPNVADVVILIENTTFCGSYFNEWADFHLKSILDYFDTGPSFDYTQYGLSLTGTIFNLVVFSRSVFHPLKVFSPVPTAQKLLAQINSIKLNSMDITECSPIHEGLACALKCFSDLHLYRRCQPPVSPQKHCILFCASVPMPSNVTVQHSPAYRQRTIDQLIAEFKQRSINLSLVCPRRLSPIISMMEMYSEDARIRVTQQTMNKHSKHIVLLNGFSLQDSKSHSYAVGSQKSTFQTQQTSKQIQQIQTQNNGDVGTHVSHVFSQPTQQTSQIQTACSSMPYTHPSGAMPQQAMMNTLNGTPTSNANFMLQQQIMSNASRMHSLQQQQIVQQHSSAAMTGMSGMGAMMAQGMRPHHHMNISSAGAMMQQAANRWQQATGQMEMHTAHSVLLSQLNKPPTCQPSASSTASVCHPSAANQQFMLQQQHQTLSTQSPGMGTMMHSHTAPSQQTTRYMPQPHSTGGSVSAPLASSGPATFPANTAQTSSGVSQTACVSVVNTSCTPSVSVTQPTVVTNSALHPHHSTSSSGLAASSTPSSSMQRTSGTSHNVKIWEGTLEWSEKRTSDSTKHVHSIPCQLSCNTNSNGDPEVVTDGWPDKLMMQLINRAVISTINKAYFDNIRSVKFNLQPCETLDRLSHVMSSGLTGCVYFSSSTPADVKVMMLLYAAEKQTYFGFIPNDQNGFIEKLKEVMAKQKHMQMQALRQQQQQAVAMAMNPGSQVGAVTGAGGLTTATPVTVGPAAMSNSVPGAMDMRGQMNAVNMPGAANPASMMSARLLSQQQFSGQPQRMSQPVNTMYPGGTGVPPLTPGTETVGPQGTGAFERQQNLLHMRQLQQQLAEAQQRELQYKAVQQQQQQIHQVGINNVNPAIAAAPQNPTMRHMNPSSSLDNSHELRSLLQPNYMQRQQTNNEMTGLMNPVQQTPSSVLHLDDSVMRDLL